MKLIRNYTCTRRVDKDGNKIWLVFEDGKKFYRIFKSQSLAIDYFKYLKTYAEMMVQQVEGNNFIKVVYTQDEMLRRGSKTFSKVIPHVKVKDSDKLFDGLNSNSKTKIEEKADESVKKPKAKTEPKPKPSIDKEKEKAAVKPKAKKKTTKAKNEKPKAPKKEKEPEVIKQVYVDYNTGEIITDAQLQKIKQQKEEQEKIDQANHLAKLEQERKAQEELLKAQKAQEEQQRIDQANHLAKLEQERKIAEELLRVKQAQEEQQRIDQANHLAKLEQERKEAEELLRKKQVQEENQRIVNQILKAKNEEKQRIEEALILDAQEEETRQAFSKQNNFIQEFKDLDDSNEFSNNNTINISLIDEILNRKSTAEKTWTEDFTTINDDDFQHLDNTIYIKEEIEKPIVVNAQKIDFNDDEMLEETTTIENIIEQRTENINIKSVDYGRIKEHKDYEETQIIEVPDKLSIDENKKNNIEKSEVSESNNSKFWITTILLSVVIMALVTIIVLFFLDIMPISWK